MTKIEGMVWCAAMFAVALGASACTTTSPNSECPTNCGSRSSPEDADDDDDDDDSGKPASGGQNAGNAGTDIFGVSTSAQSLGTFSTWAPVVSSIGVKWMRGFRTFGDIEPVEGQFDFTNVDADLATAAANGISMSGLLFYGAPWISGGGNTFPVANLAAWSTYVTTVTDHCKGRVSYWEVWNEPPNFSTDTNPADYAAIVKSAYDAAKAVDPGIRIGLAAQSNNVNWLEQTIKAGAAGHYDYITVHPYEMLGVLHGGADAEYLSIVPTIRKMLAAQDPANKDVPIWFTEIGSEVGFQSTTASTQAQDLVKAYSMGIAQGVTRIDWFEAVDGDSGPFGLVAADGTKRPSYTAMATMTQYLAGANYVGWTLLDEQVSAFVFEGKAGTVMVTWAKAGVTDTMSFDEALTIVDPLTGETKSQATFGLTESPLLIVGVPSNFVDDARDNLGDPFPWGGDYSDSTSVTVTMSGPNDEQGLHQLAPDSSSAVATALGGPARDCRKSAAQAFVVDPSFLSYTSSPIRITAVVTRAPDATGAGFNLKYESTTGIKSTGNWFSVPGSDQWYTQTWDITDDEFVGKWGYQFTFDSDTPDNAKYFIQRVTVTKP